jgi:hypothetical protein
MSRVPAAVTVWMVDLGVGSALEEVKGSLALVSDALVFTPKDDRLAERRYALGEMAQARRVRGSPVLMIVQGTGGETRRTAFYFVQPPPLEVPEEPARLALGGIGRNAKRRTRRQNAGYLGTWNREKKALVREWERQIQAAVEAARG